MSAGSFLKRKEETLAFREWVLSRIQMLFELEGTAWTKPPDERLRIRQIEEVPIIDELIEKIKGRLINGKVLPKSKFREALGYFCGLIPYLKNYTRHPNARLGAFSRGPAVGPWLLFHQAIHLALSPLPRAGHRHRARGRVDRGARRSGRPAVWLVAAVATWIGGFDILYALADRDFDRKQGIHSIPARFGVPGSLAILGRAARRHRPRSACCGSGSWLGIIYFLGVAVVVAIFIYEHTIVRTLDTSRLNVAFFNLNGYVSLVYFAATLTQV